ncbi:DUF4190 domain-containing protein [Salinibacterium sp. SYSU T00001]|uniref:DUF4190 domain-containing protein n=1 Tax=Homoserinimonas sedimenticola TaxID=2986805 RepID=UPI002235AD08|nr:DUF4190 domain-containing protein [Salinibacterium sedimenticola]MCW4385277.1 DUF4190 domain-containing protein [Salinibacterium sedimenticola]
MSTHDSDGVPPVPTPPKDAAATADEASPAAHPAPEAAPTVPPAPEAAPTVPPAPEAAPTAPPAASPYGAAGTAGNPYGAPAGAASGAPQNPYGSTPYQGYQAGPELPKGLSITSMVTGIVGVVLGFAGWGFLPAVAGVVFGHIAQRKEPHAKGFWLTGIITGYAGLALNIIIGLIFAAAFLLPLLLFSSTSDFS